MKILKNPTEALVERLLKEHQTIFDSVPAWIFYKDKENRFIRVNNSFANMMDRPKEELEGRSMLDIFPKEQAEAFWRDDQEVLKSGKSKYGIIEPFDINAGRRWVQTNKIPYVDEHGYIIGIIDFAVDITELKKAEERLKESETRFRAVFDNSGDGILVVDIETRQFTMCNRMIGQMLGYTEKEIKCLSVKDIHPDEYLPQILEHLKKLARGETIAASNTPMKRKDGSIFYADITASAITLDNKKCLVGNFRDIMIELKKKLEDMETELKKYRPE